jgi:6,7-dimethyl-8-ribityllumazine synthase
MSLAPSPPLILFVVGNFYEHVADELIAGAAEALASGGARHEVIHVPGAFEIPAVIANAHKARQLPAGRSYDGYVALGCVIRGETTHYDYICTETARALMSLSLDGLPIGNGILTVENEAQALARANRNQKNKGADAANACLRMIQIRQLLTVGGVGALD